MKQLMLVATFGVGLAFAQSDPAKLPLKTTPTEKLTVNAGFRDWSPATLAGATILSGNRTGRGGLVAVDIASGKVKWTYRPVFSTGTAAVSTAPAVSGDVVIVSFPSANPGAVAAVSLATGKELWRGPDPAVGAGVAVGGGAAYVLGKDGNVYALDVTTGKERWKFAFLTNRAVCGSQPIVRDDVIYLTGNQAPGYFIFALDIKTGQERWRYRAEAPDEHSGVCVRQPVVTADAIFAAGDHYVYAIDRATGRDRWKPVEVRRPVEGRERGVEVHGLVDADTVVIGLTEGFLIAFDKASGRKAWELPGQYNVSSPATAVAGNVLYFQGSPDGTPAAAPRATLQALDLATHKILWSFTRRTEEANWPFGNVMPFDGGLWVDSYQALVKLQ